MRTGAVELVIDVRTVPRSRTNPQYNFDVLGDELAPWQVSYDRIAELGGLRGRSQGVPAEINSFWNNQSFHNYADYALSDQFGAGLERLLELSAGRRTAIMCAEAVWWRCHRRIIADYLLWCGETVFHILAADNIAPATMTPAARPTPEGLVYPAPGEQLALNLPPPTGDG